jgi:hypothetical protein
MDQAPKVKTVSLDRWLRASSFASGDGAFIVDGFIQGGSDVQVLYYSRRPFLDCLSHFSGSFNRSRESKREGGQDNA